MDDSVMDDDIFDVESDAASSDFVPEPAPVSISPLRVNQSLVN
jgi:hypothetical protein